jgi:ABC-2 type transport system ATP-binding protein
MSIGRPVSGAAAVVGTGGAAGGRFWVTGASARVDGGAAFGLVVAVVDGVARVVLVVGFGRVVVVVDVDVVVVGAGLTVWTLRRSVPQALPVTSSTTTITLRSRFMAARHGSGPDPKTGGYAPISPGPLHRRGRPVEASLMSIRPVEEVSAVAASAAPGTAATGEGAAGEGAPVEVIRTDGLTKTYGASRAGAVTAVDHLALSVRAGEIFGLLGPNGAGKTTTVGMLTTRVVPTSGRALVGGVDVVANPALAKQVIGVVPQSNTLDRELTVRQNLYFHGRYFGLGADEAGEAADRLLEQFRLADRAGAGVATLSGGMAQRLMVARAIMHRPRILFLDEPTAGLDPQSRIALWEILAELHGAGQTILLTTHYMEEADQLCDRVAIMDHGRILALDSPAALKRSLGADTIVRVGTEAGGDETGLRRLAAVLAATEGARSAHVTDGGVLLYLSGPVARTLPRIFAAAESNGFAVNDLSVTEPSLEAVFITLTGKELRD